MARSAAVETLASLPERLKLRTGQEAVQHPILHSRQVQRVSGSLGRALPVVHHLPTGLAAARRLGIRRRRDRSGSLRKGLDRRRRRGLVLLLRSSNRSRLDRCRRSRCGLHGRHGLLHRLLHRGGLRSRRRDRVLLLLLHARQSRSKGMHHLRLLLQHELDQRISSQAGRSGYRLRSRDRRGLNNSWRGNSGRRLLSRCRLLLHGVLNRCSRLLLHNVVDLHVLLLLNTGRTSGAIAVSGIAVRRQASGIGRGR